MKNVRKLRHALSLPPGGRWIFASKNPKGARDNKEICRVAPLIIGGSKIPVIEPFSPDGSSTASRSPLPEGALRNGGSEPPALRDRAKKIGVDVWEGMW